LPLIDFNTDKNPEPTFYVAIYDVPLNVDKLLFKIHMEQYGPIKSISYNLFKLHYTVHITYANRDAAPKLENLWSIQYNKDAFRIWPDTINKQTYQKRHNNVLKLTNLPKGTKAHALLHILKEIGAMTCYIPKKGNSESYQYDRIAYIAFKTNADREKVFAPVRNNETNVSAPQVLLLNGKALVWTHTSDPCCFECGSKFHRRNTCKEFRNIQSRKNNQDRFRPLHQRLGLVSKPHNQNRSVSRSRTSQLNNFGPHVPNFEYTYQGNFN